MKESAKAQFDRLFGADDDQSPIERLRAFCSFAMNGQDWIDVEPFFGALSPPTVPEGQMGPKEPTEKMIISGCDAAPEHTGPDWIKRIYKAMLAAAPEHKP